MALTRVYFGAGHTYKHTMYSTELGHSLLLLCPSTRNCSKTRNGRRARGNKSQPCRVLKLASEVWSMPGHCIPWAELQAPSPWHPRKAGRVEKLPKLSSEKEKLFLCLIVLGQRAGGTGCE